MSLASPATCQDIHYNTTLDGYFFSLLTYKVVENVDLSKIWNTDHIEDVMCFAPALASVHARFLKLMFYVNVSWVLQCWNNVLPTLKNVMGDILASITVSGGWVASGATMVELRSIIPCDSHLPPHCTDRPSDQWAVHCWIAFGREGLLEGQARQD